MTQSTDTPQSAYPDPETEFLNMTFAGPTHVDKLLAAGYAPHVILGHYRACYRPAVARYLVAQGEVLRSEFRSEEKAEAFWAHVREDAAIERANLGEHGMAQVPDPCCCRIHAGAGNRCPDCPQHSGE